MSPKDEQEARALLLELLQEDGGYYLPQTQKREEMYRCLGTVSEHQPTDNNIVAYIISALMNPEIMLRPAPQSDPPEIAWQLTDKRNIFIKLVIRELRFGEECVYVKSFHRSIHGN